MRNLVIVSLAVILLAACGSKNTSKKSQTESITENAFLADPTIFYWDGVYYLYGTGGNMPDGNPNHDNGFLVYTSTDLKNWQIPEEAEDGLALKKGDAYGTWGFWAPQIFHYKDKFYMAYTADEQIAIATAPSPAGPFKQEEIRPVSTVTRQIDPYVFFDDDGKIYMYHVRLIDENALYVAEMNEDLTEMDESTLTKCISAEPGTWEDTESAEWRVAEGPTVLKENGKYYFFYSVNDFRSIDYAVGYATADSPYGPWTKSPLNPVIDRHLIKENGTGHGDIFFNDKNEMYYVLHTHLSDQEVGPRKTAIIQLIKEGDDVRAKAETFHFLNLTKK